VLIPADAVKIFVQLSPIDMRKSIDGLTALIVDEFSMSPQSGSIFIFYNKDRNKVKAIYWDKNGFILHYKRLDKGRFKFSRSPLDRILEINQDQFQWLFSGLDFQLMQEFSHLNYEHFY
jgi:transposase